MNMQLRSDGLTKRTGTITNYQVKRAAASFVFTDSDRTKLGVIAIAAGLAGVGGQAVATASHAASVEEDADFVEFDLDGKPIKGWLWRSPLKEGDRVEVVGEDGGDYLNVVAVARPGDRVIALYPHCSRGRMKHVKNAAVWWLLGSVGFSAVLLFGAVLTTNGRFDSESTMSALSLAMLGSSVFFALMTISLARKWMPFVRVAEKVFCTLDWPNPSNVDLVKSSKAQRRPGDPGEFGTFYFRY